MSCASERVSGQTSGPVLTSRLLARLNHRALDEHFSRQIFTFVPIWRFPCPFEEREKRVEPKHETRSRSFQWCRDDIHSPSRLRFFPLASLPLPSHNRWDKTVRKIYEKRNNDAIKIYEAFTFPMSEKVRVQVVLFSSSADISCSP